jgi:hypothetical protein
MITLEQVKLLEEKVESLISVVKSLYGERDSLKETLTQKESRIEELEAVLHSFEISQAKIEESVMNALNQLDVFESSCTHNSSQSISSSESVSSEGSSLSNTSNSEQIPTSSSDAITQQEISSESSTQRTDVDDSDKQMDIF